MSDPEAVRKEWARRVTQVYDGWPQWLSPRAATQAPWAPGDSRPAGDAGRGRAADASAGHTPSGWSWGLTPAQVEGVDRRLRLEERTGEIAHFLRNERRYWGLEPGGE